MLLPKCLTIVVLLLCQTATANAQVELAHTADLGPPPYFQDFINVRAGDLSLSRLRCYFKIPYDGLQFVRLAPDSYTAKFELAIAILDKKEFQIDSKVIEREISVPSFEETNQSSQYCDIETTFDLEPGKYNIWVGLTDQETKVTQRQRARVELRDFSETMLAMSDILFADSIRVLPDGQIAAIPIVNTPRKESTHLFGYFDVYRRNPQEKLNVEITVRNVRNKKVFQDNRDFDEREDVTPIVFELAEGDLTLGIYRVRVKAKEGKNSSVLETTFSVYWRGFPLTGLSMKTAIAQLQYIASGSERKKIKKAPPDSQRAAVLAFWKKHDPTPGTEENELMDEFYRRVAYANEHFSQFRDGWKTDMGMIYIVLGEPSEVQRDPFNTTYRTYYSSRPVKALEIWQYYRYNRFFVFIDETGFGEFRLANPVSVNELMSLRD